MPPTALLLLSSHQHAVALAGAPLDPLDHASGFFLLLAAAVLIVATLEKLRDR
jgi:hypothetical protein